MASPSPSDIKMMMLIDALRSGVPISPGSAQQTATAHPYDDSDSVASPQGHISYEPGRTILPDEQVNMVRQPDMLVDGELQRPVQRSRGPDIRTATAHPAYDYGTTATELPEGGFQMLPEGGGHVYKSNEQPMPDEVIVHGSPADMQRLPEVTVHPRSMLQNIFSGLGRQSNRSLQEMPYEQ